MAMRTTTTFICRSLSSTLRRPSIRTVTTHAAKRKVKIVEVGPRDGLQNEKGAIIPVDTKVQLVNRLVDAGLNCVEVGSFVSPKWVPQMGGTTDVLKQITQSPGVTFPVLVPNKRGLADFLALLGDNPHLAPSSEIAIFTSATDSFNRANLNCPVSDSLKTLAEIVPQALERGVRVRGYVSVVVYCPYEGKVDARRVTEVSERLVEMGCYEVSLGDTVGRARAWEVQELVGTVGKAVGVDKLAGHFHDTYGQATANVLAALHAGIRTIDASVGGLGGCPYSPGATGNVATEDVLYALEGSEYVVEGRSGTPPNVEQIAAIGSWISGQLGRETTSRVGRALEARRRREEKEKAKREAKL